MSQSASDGEAASVATTLMGGGEGDFGGPDVPRTENGGVCCEDTGVAVLDLFFRMCPKVPVADVHEMLEAAWAEDPLGTIKVIFVTGNCRKGQVS